MSLPRGRIIILNGCSSTGKTSLAACLQRVAEDDQYLHLQLDAFRAMEPSGYFSRQRKEHWPARLEALCRSINGAAVQFARCGQNVLVDHVLSRQAWTYAAEDLRGEHVILVKVSCSLEDAEARERIRPDREIGLARSQWNEIHAGHRYDMEVDTSDLAVTEAAQHLHAWLRTDPKPSAFPTMLNSAGTA